MASKVYILDDGRKVKFPADASDADIRSYLVQNYGDKIDPAIVQAHNRDTSQQSLHNMANLESRTTSRTGGIEGGEDIEAPVTGQSIARGIAKHTKDMLMPTPRSLAETAILGPMKPGIDLVRGLIGSGAEAKRQFENGETARGTVTELSMLDPFASSVGGINESVNRGERGEAVGAGLEDAALLAGGGLAGKILPRYRVPIGKAMVENADTIGNPTRWGPAVVRGIGKRVIGSVGESLQNPSNPSVRLGGNAADLEPEHINQNESTIPPRQPLVPTSLEEGEVSSSPQVENASQLPEETIPQTVRFRGEGGRIAKRVENVSTGEPIERFERQDIPQNSNMAAAFRRRASLSDMADRGERYGLLNAADVIEKLEKPYSEYGPDLISKKFIGPKTMERIGNYERSVVPGEMRGAVPQGTLKFMEDVRSGNIKPIGENGTSLEDQLKDSLRLRGIDPDLEQGGHAGNGVVSEEEISRPGRNYVVSKGGNLTYHGKQFAPESIGANQTHVTVLPNGEFRVNAGQELNPTQRLSLKRALE